MMYSTAVDSGVMQRQSGTGLSGGKLEPETLALEVEALPGNSEGFGGGVHLALVLAERGLDHLALDARERRD